MLIASTKRRLLVGAARFRNARDGNIAVLFALALVPILGFVGAAVDYSRASRAHTAMQTALDSTALMLSKDDSAGNLSAATLSSKAQNYFNSLYSNTDTGTVAVTASYSNSAATGAQIVMKGAGTVKTAFLGILGMPQISIGSSSTTAWGTSKLRVAMALDNTGSMADDGKISALITASKNLIDQLSASAQSAGDVYISVVPFANVVNLGTSFKSSGTIDWSNWSTTGSIEENYTCGSYNQAPGWNGSGVMKCGSSNNNINQWNGCVMDRNQSYDVSIAAASTSVAYYPADQSSYCPQQISPLSYNWTQLKQSIGAMTPSGGTNQPIGLVWAWQTLQQSAPFNAPAEDSNYVYKKAIILLSDGLNTMDRWPAYGNGQVQYNGQIDARQKILCDAIKAAGVTIYTIQVNTGGDPTSSVLQYCASGASNFFLLTSANQVISTFNSIGTSLARLRIAK